VTRQSTLGRNRFWGKTTPPKTKAEFFNVVTGPAPAGEGEVATIRLYGPIDSWGGWWGVSAEEMSATLDSLGPQVNQIVLRINSPGGEVFEGLAILNMLRAHRASVTAVVDGLAASAASVVAVGCDRTVMSPGTQLMIHDARSVIYGPASDLRKEADVLESINGGLIEVYQGKAGDKDWPTLLTAETWYGATEAVEAGLADQVAVVPDAGMTATPGEDLDADDDEVIVVPLVDDTEAHLQRRYGAHQPPSASPRSGSTNQQEEAAMTFTSEQLNTMRQDLGLPETADEATIVAALSEALEERAEAPAAATTEVPAGMSLVSTEVLDQLRTQASQGAEARAQQLTERRDNAITNAIRTGRITPAQRDHFATLWDADPAGTETLLASLAPGLVPVDELGRAGELENPAPEMKEGAVSGFAAGLGISEEALRG
jgi:ATP-dependent protease ClpP protease subunit